MPGTPAARESRPLRNVSNRPEPRKAVCAINDADLPSGSLGGRGDPDESLTADDPISTLGAQRSGRDPGARSQGA
jgi:hypothetical protein